MIHDVILSLITEKEPQIIRELLNEDISSQYIHPAEIKILKDIVKIANQFRDIKKFILIYGTDQDELAIEKIDPENRLVGFYIRQFANGIDNVLENYYYAVTQLERKFLIKPTVSLMFIFHELEKFRPVFEFLQKLISGIETQKLHGCQILEYLEDNSMHGNKHIQEAIQTIQKSVYSIFIQQLYQWLNGKLIDKYEEFFISNADVCASSEKKPVYSTQSSVNTFHSSDHSLLIGLWQYDINFDMLPHYFPKSWAEKVLFIGRTVLTLNSKSNPLNNKTFSSPELTALCHDNIEYEKKLYEKFHQLQQPNKLTILTFELIIDEIKLNVTELLSNLAIKDADLIKQLELFKDFYLLGRGELFYEFIGQLNQLYVKSVTDHTVRDINRLFHASAVSVNYQDCAELFQFELNKNEVDESIIESRGLFQYLTLTYKIKSPLHLIFSPKVLIKYNELFRFLIRVRKIQYDLQMLWCYHREKKIQGKNDIVQFRNKLMFLINNLMYYLHVDVLESQFSIMMDKIKETKDFEKIIRAHSCFQANILSLCFHLETINPMVKSMQTSLVMENPVLAVFKKIFKLCEEFTAFALTPPKKTEEFDEYDKLTFTNFEDVFGSLVDELFRMLSTNSAAVAITQLLLRLDFNYWFSTKNTTRD
ncbi:hypothetical protein PVAND_003756 [Polypedilum vanderplanki]|uniref:Gamma-tubulin complex component n=1 Tax=Polypedilum vanderplanki TaxID=319348 RepID=A0A9J6BVJ4_POLVA|nr:hypothetical protein PVAND_003756 [Polypedilum vanderplanki]